jgi:hypothetical protein
MGPPFSTVGCPASPNSVATVELKIEPLAFILLVKLFQPAKVLIWRHR